MNVTDHIKRLKYKNYKSNRCLKLFHEMSYSSYDAILSRPYFTIKIITVIIQYIKLTV